MSCRDWLGAGVVGYCGGAITFSVCTSSSIRAVRGPAVGAVAEVIILDAFFLFIIYATLPVLHRYRRLFHSLCFFVFAVGVALYGWQRALTRDLLVETQQVLRKTFPELEPHPFLYEVCITPDGLVFWCWLNNLVPAERREEMSETARSVVEMRVRAKYPIIKKVVEIRF